MRPGRKEKALLSTPLSSTAPKREEENLRRFATVVRDSNDAITIQDFEGRITAWNRGAELLYGYSEVEALAMNIERLTAPSKVDEQRDFVRRLVAGEAITSFETRRVTKDGRILDVWMTVTKLVDKAGKPIGIASTERDTTALKRETDQYRRLFESAKDGILIVDAETGAIADVNPFLVELLGFSPEEFLGKKVWDLGFLGDIVANEANFAELQQKEYIRYEDMPLETADGRRIEVEFISNVYLVNRRKVVQCSIRDITERKRTEEVLRETNEYLDNLFNHANVPIIVWDPQFKILRFNQAFESLTGRTAAEVLGQSLEILFPPDLKASSMAQAQNALAGERWDTREIAVQHRDGLVRAVVWNSATLFAPDGKTALAVIAQGFDMTDRRQVEEEKDRVSEELARSNKDLEQFAYVASHDLQEPLRMVSSYVQLLAQRYEGQLDDKAQKYIAYAVDGAVRMQRLIEDLLVYSRVGTRGGPLGVVDSRSALASAIQNLAKAIEESAAVITQGELPLVRADAPQLTQVFQNLLSNAIKFHGEAPPRVHISAEDKGREWVFSVKDDGIGIDPQYKDRVFVIFQRLHTRQEYPGTGIGLAVCKKIVERHGGRMWFESEPGKGSTFFFSVLK